MKSVTLTIDNRTVTAAPGTTILEAARQYGITIPTLCFQEKLESHGSCWMCIVELKGRNRFVPACSTSITGSMEIETDNAQLREMRRKTLERLLEQHSGDCEPPCRDACPAGCSVPAYLGAIGKGNDRKAVTIIHETIPLPATLGRICPAPCEDVCRRHGVDDAVSICALKRFAADRDHESPTPFVPAQEPASGTKVAIIGAGPAGLSAAYYLLRKGHGVTIFDSRERPGGMLYYGIPRFRLPAEDLDADIAPIMVMGGDFVPGTSFGTDITADDLRRKGFDAIFLAAGAWQASRLGIEGEDLPGVLTGIGFLRKIAENTTLNPGRRIVVIGGGNTAVDAARTARRLGAEQVTLLYRRTRDDMPANAQEILEAEAEGITLELMAAPARITEADGALHIRVRRMTAGEPDESGRRRPVPVEGADFTLTADTVITAIGQQVDPAIAQTCNLRMTDRGTIETDQSTCRTSAEGVFAGGDCVSGADIAVTAVAQGRRAALAIDRHLKGEPDIKRRRPFNSTYGPAGTAPKALAERAKPLQRAPMHELAGKERLTTFREVASGLTEEQARAEATRCLRCGCSTKNDCTLRSLASQHGIDSTACLNAGSDNAYIVRTEHVRYEREKCVDCGICIRTIEEAPDRQVDPSILIDNCPTGALS
ncbi:FAD-dependent oxidoreductase [Prosthecochloris sp. N3]|uniref:FAD-dependent oxidoreductase n=1 Tax=Prosthecochloris ethylica TaxID=2743976 RepID=A0ABR9XTZ2_9CHLB|nr:FAD-dependent oxidoreductase [Prosthecochloris ethylica]MBF0586576.1 FAD-dependent oxidoreductase [Prosthecochloris ethylica]MBF0637527.1 FAD-dependent oxidoreductase [Prosthecochloris ethylica]NUK47676.1 FAD-dependent oxidoreductase [Prosthecochloris ethylica]